MRSMTDFIMEQESSCVSYTNDQEIMEGFMKVSAIGAIAECYCEHAAIATFSEEAGLNVFTESDDNVMKKAWTATKEFFLRIWDWLKGLVKSIVRYFTKSSIDRLIVKLKQYQADARYKNELKGIDIDSLAVHELIGLVEAFGHAVKAGSDKEDGISDSAELKQFKDAAEEFLKGAKEKDNWKINDEESSDIEQLIVTLEAVSNANIPSRGSKLLKKFDFDKNNYKKKDDKEAVNKELVKEIKKCANLLAKAYDKFVSNLVKLVNKVLNKNIKDTDKETFDADAAFKQRKKEKAAYDPEADYEEESYRSNTDGYYFL